MFGALPEWFAAVAIDFGVVAGLLTAFEVIRRVALRPAWHMIQRINTTIEAVHEQLVPNGGASLRDVCDRLEDQHVVLNVRLDTVDNRMSVVEERVSAIAKRGK